MRYTKSFHLFWRAVKSTRHEMWVSLQVPIVITLILSFIISADPVHIRYKSSGLRNIAYHIQGESKTNAFTLKMDWGVTAFNYNNKSIVLEMAKILSESMAGKPVEYSKNWEEPGFDYNYDDFYFL